MAVLQVDDDEAIAATVSSLRAGELVVVPTDTVYGLAALPTDAGAVERIYRVKERPARLHLPVLGASLTQVRQLGIAETNASQALAERWWPGPLTMVFGFAPRAGRPPWLEGRDEVAVRIPQHAFLLSLLRATGVLMVTSANLHGAATPPSATGVAEVLGSLVALVIDGGPAGGAASTLVNVREGNAAVEREGALSARSIAETVAAAAELP